jgi:hypothetical protein
MTSNNAAAPTIPEIRKEMRRKLSANERSAYRGITMSGLTGTMYERLIAVDTAEELIVSEWTGKLFIPSDDPENVYLISIGRGITAQCNPDYVKEMVEYAGPLHVSEKTMSEMDAEYRNKAQKHSPEEEKAKLEEFLNEVAAKHLAWAEQRLGSNKAQRDYGVPGQP